MEQANKVKLGAFLLITIILLIGSFLSVGISRIFEPTVKAMTVINTSVEGLSVGSPVKYLGVPVGRITRIAMRNSDGYIAVYFDLNPSMMDDMLGNGGAFRSSAGIVEVLRRHNLTCFINAAGIMGGSYLELGRSNDPPAIPHLDQGIPEGVSYIPSRPSHIGNAIQNISRMLDDMQQVNLVQLNDKLNQTLDNLNSVFGGNDVNNIVKNMNSLTAELKSSSRNLHLILSEENIKTVNNAIANADNAIQKLDRAVDFQKMPEMLDNLNQFLIESRALIKLVESEGKELKNGTVSAAALFKFRAEASLTRLDNTLKKLDRALNDLEDNPDRLLRGNPEVKIPSSR